MRNIEILKERAENMRKTPGKYERIFRDKLKAAHIPFKMQWVLGRYIVDFVIGRTVVELDGAGHSTDEQLLYDRTRTQYLSKIGYKVIRIDNCDVAEYDLSSLKKIAKTTPKFNKQSNDHTPGELIKSAKQTQAEIKANIEKHRNLSSSFYRKAG